MNRFERFVSYFMTAIICTGLGYAWCFHHEPDHATHFAYTIKKEMQTGNYVFYVGDIKFSPTKYKGLWLAEVKK